MGPHKNLLVWQKSMDLVRKVYQTTVHYPQSEIYGLISQMRRCAISIPSNIAEGYGRGSNAELIRFLYIALGSSNELDTQIIISKDLLYLDDEETIILEKMNNEVMMMLHSLIGKRKVHEISKPDPENLST